MTADWSSFLPDLLVGIMTGLLVGLALYIFERNRRTAETRSQMLNGWLMLAPRIERIVWQPIPKNTASYAELGTTLTRVRDMAEGYPLYHWQQVLMREDLQALLDLLSDYDALEALADRVEGNMATACYLKGIDSEVGNLVGIVARAQAYASSEEDLAEQFAGPNEFLLKFADLAASLREHSPFLQAEQHFLEMRERINAAQIEFFNAVRQARSSAYTLQAEKEERRNVRERYLRHPIKTWRVQRRNRKRRAQEPKVAIPVTNQQDV